MKEIEVSTVVDAPREEVERRLSPSAIVDYVDTYTVRSTEELEGGAVLTLSGENIEMVAEFTELEDGYAYRQRGDEGPFDEMATRITVSGGDETEVSVRSEFTFGGFVKDWFGTSIRRDEMERLLANLERDLEEGAADADEGREDRDRVDADLEEGGTPEDG